MVYGDEFQNGRFFYQKLSANEKAVYDALYRGIPQRKLRFQVGVKDANLSKVIRAFLSDHPEIYWIADWNLLYTENEIWFRNPSPYLYSAEKCLEFERHLANIVDCFRIYDDDFEKELAVHHYLTRRVKFDHAEVEGRKPFQAENHNIIGPLIYGVGVCEGIAKACQYLLERIGVTCLLVNGESRSFRGERPMGHAWNIVKIHNFFYHLDTSHDLCLSEGSSVPQYHYFNLTDADILCDHRFSPSDYEGIVCHSCLDNYYKKYGMYFEDEEQLTDALKKELKVPLLPRGYKRMTFKVSRTFPSDDAIFRLIHRVCHDRYVFSVSVAELQRIYSVTFQFCGE